MIRTNPVRMFGMFLLAAGVMLGGRPVHAETAAPNAAAPQAQAAPATAIELFVDYSEDSYAEEATLKELTSLLRDAVKAELEADGFQVIMLAAYAQTPANAPYLLFVRLTDYRTLGVQRAIYARYELTGGGKIVKQKLTQSTVKSALQLPKVLGAQIANIARDRIRGVPVREEEKGPKERRRKAKDKQAE